MELHTERLTLIPMTAEELTEKIAAEPDPHMKHAYGEMRLGVLAEPQHALWHTEWRFVLPATGLTVGGAGFKGAPSDGAADIGYGTDEAWRGKGYAKEAVTALVEWAFRHGADVVTAEAEPDNLPSQHVLAHCGFRRIGPGAEGERWELRRRFTAPGS